MDIVGLIDPEGIHLIERVSYRNSSHRSRQSAMQHTGGQKLWVFLETRMIGPAVLLGW